MPPTGPRRLMCERACTYIPPLPFHQLRAGLTCVSACTCIAPLAKIIGARKRKLSEHATVIHNWKTRTSTLLKFALCGSREHAAAAAFATDTQRRHRATLAVKGAGGGPVQQS